jgi:hypothetical protein
LLIKVVKLLRSFGPKERPTREDLLLLDLRLQQQHLSRPRKAEEKDGGVDILESPGHRCRQLVTPEMRLQRPTSNNTLVTARERCQTMLLTLPQACLLSEIDSRTHL